MITDTPVLPKVNKGYPASICTSVNEVVCHGIPNDRPLKEGDIVNVDLTSIVDAGTAISPKPFNRRGFCSSPRVGPGNF